MTRRWALILLLVMVAALLAFVMQESVRTILLLPLLYVIWLVGLVLASFPHILWWLIFLAFLFWLASRNLFRLPSFGRRRIPTEEQLNQLETWMKRIDQSKHGYYFRWRLARQISQLALNIVAIQERLSPDQARQALLASRLNLPSDMQAYMIISLSTQSPHDYSDMQINPKDDPLQIDPSIIIAYLERLSW
jgi:hypothetical protein